MTTVDVLRVYLTDELARLKRQAEDAGNLPAVAIQRQAVALAITIEAQTLRAVEAKLDQIEAMTTGRIAR